MKLKITTIRGQLAHGICRIIVSSYRLDFGSGTDLQIVVKELQVDKAYLSKTINNKILWYTGMELLDHIYH